MKEWGIIGDCSEIECREVGRHHSCPLIIYGRYYESL